MVRLILVEHFMSIIRFGIEETGNVYGKSFYVNMNTNILDTTNYFRVDKVDGFNYQYFQYNQPGANNVTTIIQAGELGAFMSYSNSNIVVSQNGASCSPLTIMTPNTTNPLTIKNSSSADLCVINNVGNMSLSGNMSVSGNISCTRATSATNLSGNGGFSYYYGNGLTGSSRILTDFSAGPDYINFAVVKNGSMRGAFA